VWAGALLMGCGMGLAVLTMQGTWDDRALELPGSVRRT
jgi:hypothetical protein